MLMLDRRMLVRAGSAAFGAAALAPTAPALAHAPQAGRSKPEPHLLGGWLDVSRVQESG